MLAHDCGGWAAVAGPPHVQRIQERIEQQAAQHRQQTRLEALQNAPETRYGSRNPEQEYQRQAQRLLERYGPATDYSRMDWMIAQDMAKSGHFTRREIEHAIRTCSPHIDERKAGHIDDYAARTAERAWQSPETVQHRQEQQRQHQQSPGLE